MYFNFDEVVDRAETNSEKHSGADRELIHLSVADMDFRTPKPIRDKFASIIEHGIFGYTFVPESHYSALINWMNYRFGTKVERDWILFIPRINLTASILVRLLTKESDSVIIHTPAYGPLIRAITSNNRRIVTSTLKDIDGTFKMDFEELEKKLDGTERLFILCSPHNPTGRVWSKDELNMLTNFCVKHNLYILSDEIHQDFIHQDENHIPIIEFEEIKDRVLLCNSITKTFNIAGIQLANLIIPNQELRDRVKNEFDILNLWDANIFAASTMETACNSDECKMWLKSMNKYVSNNFLLVKEYFEEYMPEFKMYIPESTFLIWVNYKELNINEEKLKDWFVNTAKVEVSMGTAFSEDGSGYFRMNVACSRKLLEEALIRMKNAYEFLK